LIAGEAYAVAAEDEAFLREVESWREG